MFRIFNSVMIYFRPFRHNVQLYDWGGRKRLRGEGMEHGRGTHALLKHRQPRDRRHGQLPARTPQQCSPGGTAGVTGVSGREPQTDAGLQTVRSPRRRPHQLSGKQLL